MSGCKDLIIITKVIPEPLFLVCGLLYTSIYCRYLLFKGIVNHLQVTLHQWFLVYITNKQCIVMEVSDYRH